jgi:hypothetical protein
MRSLLGVAVVALILAGLGLGIKAIFVSSRSAEAAGISTYQLHMDYPDMRNLPVHEIPLP